MKMQTNINTVSTCNLMEQKSFQISNNFHAFKILSDGLYSDKITAILRELSCNAIDAHTAIGSTEQFVIHLPSVIDNTFYIKDFGIGMSHDAVMNHYSTYFYSNKNDSNEQIGGLGLGAKSPFSYTDSFSVESVFNGQQNTYNAFISENGCPAIVLLSSELTDEKNGVKVSFPVKKEDYNEFRTKLQKVVTFFHIKPMVINGNNFECTEQNYYFKKEKWGIREGYDNLRSRIIMGGVAYPVDVNVFKDDGLIFKILHRSNIDMFFNIGDVSVNPSRESINYRKDDIQKIQTFINDVIVKDAEEEAVKILNESKGLWNSISQFNTLLTKNYVVNVVITTKNMVFNVGDYVFNGYGTLDNKVKLPQGFYANYCESSVYNNRRTVKMTEDNHIQRLTPSSTTIIIFNDMKIGGKSKIEHYIKSKHNMLHYIIEPASCDKGKYTKEDISTMFFGADVILTSTMDKKLKKQSIEQTLKYFMYKGNISEYGAMSYFHDSRIDFNKMLDTSLSNNETIIYSLTPKNFIDNKISNTTISQYVALRKLHLIGKVRFISVPMNGVLHKIITEKNDPKIINSGTTAGTIIKELVNVYVNSNKRRLQVFNTVESILNVFDGGSDRLNTRFNDFINEYTLKRTDSNKNKKIDEFCVKHTINKNLYNKLKKKIGSESVSLLSGIYTTNTQASQHIINEYPIIKKLFSMCYSSDVVEQFDSILEYMNLVDGKQKTE